MIDFGLGVTLGPLCMDNFHKYWHWRNNYSIWKWCRQRDVISLEEHQSWYEWQAHDPSVKMYEIITKECIGVCGLTDIDTVNQRAEFSLYIAPKYALNGYGKKALKTLCEHGFKNLNLHSIWGETFEGNPASNMFESIGFVKEGSRREHYFRAGKFIDAHLYSLLRREYDPTHRNTDWSPLKLSPVNLSNTVKIRQFNKDQFKTTETD